MVSRLGRSSTCMLSFGVPRQDLEAMYMNYPGLLVPLPVATPMSETTNDEHVEECCCVECQKYPRIPEHEEVLRNLHFRWMEEASDEQTTVKHVDLPFSRVKRIMKADQDVKMVRDS